MTEADPRPDEEPTPPTSTSWSEEPAEADDELAPPFVPGGARADREAEPAPPFQPEAEAAAEWEPTESEPTESETTEPEPSVEAQGFPDEADEAAFPFDRDWEEAAEAAAEEGESEGEFPFEAFDIGDEGSDAATVEEEETGTTEPVETDEPAAEQPVPEQPDLVAEPGAIVGEPTDFEPEEPAIEIPVAEAAEAEAPGEAHHAHSLADRLEEMADRLRAEGSAAAEAEMASPDRFTALLAGLLAGYLAGRK